MSQVDFDAQPYNAQVSEQPAKSGCGCWAWGCLAVFVIGAMGSIGIGVGGYMWASSQVQTYTAEAPKQLPVVEYEPEELAALEERLETFKTVAEEGKEAEELVLTATDINALIQSNEKLKGKVFAKIEDGQVGGDVSFPTDIFPGGKGRFFNAYATFDVSMHKGVLIVTLTGAEVNGEPVPPHIIEAMSRENLAKDAYKDPETAKMMRRVESLTIEDDKIILKLKAESDPEAEPSIEANSEPDTALQSEAEPGSEVEIKSENAPASENEPAAAESEPAVDDALETEPVQDTVLE